MATEATEIVHGMLTEYSNSGDRFRCSTLNRRLFAEWATRHPRPDRIPTIDGSGFVLPADVTEPPGCPPASGEFLPYLPDDAPARAGDQNKSSKLARSGVYCSDEFRAHVRPHVLAAVPAHFRRQVVEGTRGIGAFACYTRLHPDQISVFSYCGTNSPSDIYRVLLLPASLTDYAARCPSSDLVGLCRSDDALALRVMPDALIEAGHDALGVRCIDDPECGLLTAFGVSVAGGGLCPDAATTRLVRAADKDERGRLERRRRLAPVVAELTRLGIPVPVPAESAAAAGELAARCLEAAEEGVAFSLGGGIWLEGVRPDVVGTPGPDRRPNPDYVPPAGVTWREYEMPGRPGISYFTWWRDGDDSPRGDYGGFLTGLTAARAWRATADRMTRRAAEWADR